MRELDDIPDMSRSNSSSIFRTRFNNPIDVTTDESINTLGRQLAKAKAEHEVTYRRIRMPELEAQIDAQTGGTEESNKCMIQ
jgi:hypothetical protein